MEKTSGKEVEEKKTFSFFLSLFHRRRDLLLRLRAQLGEPHARPGAVLHILFAALGDALFFWGSSSFFGGGDVSFERKKGERKTREKNCKRKKSSFTFSSAGSMSFLRNESTQSLKQRSTSELYMRRLVMWELVLLGFGRW